MSIHRCWNCRWFNAPDDYYRLPPSETTLIMFDCVRHAPIIVPSAMNIVGAWPSVRSNDGCGEWEDYDPKPSKTELTIREILTKGR